MLRILKFMASLRVTVVALLLLCVLVFWGTIYQSDHGIYLAKERFFYSWIISAGGVPLFPGGMLLMTLIFFNLLVSFFVHFGMGWKMAGALLAHVGLIMMLGGGFWTMLTSDESTLVLQEGETSHFAVAFDEWELAIRDKETGSCEVMAVDLNDLEEGRTLVLPELDLEIEPIAKYRNAQGFLYQESIPDDLPASVSGIHFLKRKSLENDGPRNMAGLTALLRSPAGERKVLFYGRDIDALPHTLGDSTYYFQLRKKRFLLPVDVHLVDFRHKTHPGSSLPSDFRSLITVKHGDGPERDVVIEMNHPFRFGAWTFFQMEYRDRGAAGETSIFTATYNTGRLIPYFATGITTFGLCMHFISMLWARRGRRLA